MKKIFFLLFTLCVCLSISAQEHMKFMGIPLDGTIDNFALKLKAKGVTYDAARSKSLPPGSKSYNGTFMGEKATFVVSFNTKSRVVFSVMVEMSYSSPDVAFYPFNDIVRQLLAKYPNADREEDQFCGDDEKGSVFHIYNKGEKKIGVIIQRLRIPSSPYSTNCTIYLMYTDVDNLQKSEAINNEDL